MPARRRRTGSESEQNYFVSYDNVKPGITQYSGDSNSNVIADFSDLSADLESFEKTYTMTSQDRTQEFFSTVHSMQSPNAYRISAAVKDPRKAKMLQGYSEFMSVAKSIGQNIANTYHKLEKLTLLAKKKSLFNDRSVEIQELTYIIKSDLNTLNEQIAQLQEVSKYNRLSLRGKHLQSHSSSVVLALQSKLASMSTDFKQVLEVRTENLKQQKHRREQFSQTNMRTLPTNSVLLGEDQVALDMESVALIPRGGTSQQQQMLMHDQTDQYLQSRADTMQSIESTIVELGGIFQQLAHMVKEQEEIVERIDANIEDAELNIEAAHTQILKYFRTVSSNRWLMIKIFGVLIFFFIFFVVFVL